MILICAILACGIATWRITRMIRYEHGPGDIFKKFRRMFGAGEFHPEDPDSTNLSDDDIAFMMNSPIPYDKFTSDLLTCFACLSVWIAAIFSPATMYTLNVLDLFNPQAWVGMALVTIGGSAIALIAEDFYAE